MGGVFLNYRTGDGDWAAALVKRELSSRFGADNVFYAGRSIRLGEDFSREILGRLRQCEVLLALIGPRWVTAADRQGSRRLDKPDDWVRREISEAFQVGLRVIPVLLDGIDRLNEATLPDDIAQLARCQYLRMHHRSDDFDLTRLVDELIELVPGLVTNGTAAQPVPGHVARHEQHQAGPGLASSPSYGSPHRGRWANGKDGELRSMVTRLRQALSDPAGDVAVQDLVQVTAGHTLDALRAHDPTNPRHVDDSDIPAVLEERLASYERDMAPVMRLVATGICSDDHRQDGLWIRIVKRFLDRRDRPPRSSEQEFRIAVEGYPSLLLTYVVGIAGMAVGREDLVYRLLGQTMVRAVDGQQVPLMRALALRHVVDPRYAAGFPKWGENPPYQALSVHLRHILRPAFSNVMGDREYACYFENYEYLRSLLELHNGAFSSLGEFAVRLDRGDAAVRQRMVARLTADSALLRSGAFDGDTDQVTAAWCALKQSTYDRYP
ncbi:hypothetical protein JOF56_009980 [Kibdelosporangium banguiense]|uniref:TIR domain-containing protein n=1 Tax=Kibdelosporangium banguiense TaxID=1365924 RepID=A0ABS4TYX6_9PSEU|nr:toll/interleukin-1 receptor domain-containing protein [Kibdelosporangium banguiense]MBP2329595.1 hypothetical protein [Kibdelosporangium banguiense]